MMCRDRSWSVKLSIDKDTVMIQTNKAGTHHHELEKAALTGPSQGSSNLCMVLNFNYTFSALLLLQHYFTLLYSKPKENRMFGSL